jgi:hypothetical protein
MTGKLDHEVAGETVRALDNDCPSPIGQQAFEHLCKAGPITHGVRAAHRRVIERVDHLEAARLGVSRDRGELPLVAILVRPDVRLARGPQIADCLGIAAEELSLDSTLRKRKTTTLTLMNFNTVI